MTSSARKAEIERSDAVWQEQQTSHGWVLPAPNPAWYRWPGVRWLRYAYNVIMVGRTRSYWSALGVGVNGSNPYDDWVLWAIVRGWW